MWFQNTDFSGIRAIVIGDVMLDQYWNGITSRVSPEAPVPVVHISSINNRLGGAGNVANNLSALGANVSLFAYTGDDESAEILNQLLIENKIKPNIFKFPEYQTIKKLRVLSRNQQLIRLDIEKSFFKVDQTKLLTCFEEELNNCDVVVISDYAKGTITDPQSLIRMAKNKNIPVIIDPKKNDFSLYKNATIITPNLKEFQDVVGVCLNEGELIKRGRNLIKTNNLDALIITRGSEGMTAIPANSPDIHLAACGNEVYDVTGAGDTVVAALAVALAKKIRIVDAARFANLAASIVVGKVGTSTVTLKELQKASFQTSIELPSGVIKEEQLIQLIKHAQSKGEQVVFTNGCYDILHYGHIKYLEKAKSFGDRLVVGVNDDKSVSKLKGSGRPINSLEKRMAVLAGLRNVDWVVSFSESTPGRLVEALNPDVIVKTDEHFKSVEDIPASEGVNHVLSKGGKVYLVSRTFGVSSTELIEASEI